MLGFQVTVGSRMGGSQSWTCSPSRIKRGTSAPTRVGRGLGFAHRIGNQRRQRLSPSCSLAENAETQPIPEEGLQPLKLLVEMQPLYGEFWFGPKAKTAWIWSVVTIFLAISRTQFTLFTSVVQKNFWNALSAKDSEKFQKFLGLLGITVLTGPIILTLYAWSKEMLSLKWREVLSSQLIKKYMSDKKYLETTYDNRLDNPDQRMTEDVLLFTTTATNLMTQLVVTVLDFIVFSVLLYSIYPPLLYVLLANCLLGTALTIRFGRGLTVLNRQQLRKEADLRYTLVRVRENAESVAFYRGDEREGNTILNRFEEAVSNLLKLIGFKRNLGFLQRAYDYFPNILPTAVVAPKYFAGDMELGSISQIVFSYNHVLQDLGIIVSEFGSISAFAANVRRLTQMREALMGDVLDSSEAQTVERTEKDGELTLKNLNTYTPVSPRRSLAKDISLSMKQGDRLLVKGNSGVGKSSLMRTIAEGSVTAPPKSESFFLPQRPYVVLGSLKSNTVYPNAPDSVSDEEVLNALELSDLGNLASRVGGLHDEQINLALTLSLGEQQRLSFARLRLSGAKFAILDESTSALDPDSEALMYKSLPDDMMIVSVSNKPSVAPYHNVVLELRDEGKWTFDKLG